ncbi:MAG: hypothetical protein EOM87_00625 [Clostridia bacterium]|nr:hypothetical protein [Clostridia bacterium]
MESIIIKEGEYSEWGRVLELCDGQIEVKVTLDIGPRIIYLAPKGGYNIMFEDSEDKITKGGEYFEDHFEDGRIWHIIGGHRLWKAPEELATYYPDLDKVSYEINGNSVIFVTEVETTTGILKTLGITMLGGGRLRVRHEFYNTLNKPINAALWGLTVLKAGGTVYFPINDKGEGFLPTRNYVLWPYTDINDKRFSYDDQYFSVSQSISEKPFKIGAFLKKGVAGYYNNGVLFIKKFAADDNCVYPDFGCNFETYTDNSMIECESLSPMYRIDSDKSEVHYEEWSLSCCNPEDIMETITKHIDK